MHKLILGLILSILLIHTYAHENDYDYIIVGGGSSGSAFAYAINNLDLDRKILIIERGEDETANPSLDFPNFNTVFTANTSDKQVRQYILTYEPQLGSRNLDSVAAIAAGGGTQVAGSVYTRSNQKDFDYWNANYGLTGIWSYSALLPCYIHMENFSNPFNPNDPISSVRGMNGVLQIIKQ